MGEDGAVYVGLTGGGSVSDLSAVVHELNSDLQQQMAAFGMGFPGKQRAGAPPMTSAGAGPSSASLGL